MSTDESQLIIQAQQGDMQAFEKLIYRYDRHVLAIAASYRNSPEDAKDIYQEVFLRVYKGLKNFERKSEFSTWLYRIAVNVCISFRSREKKYAYAQLESDYDENDEQAGFSISNVPGSDDETDRHLLDKEIKEQVRAAMNSLSPQQKMVFTLKHLREMKIREIAGIMKCGEGTVKKYLFTATQKMREKLKDFR
ncbi:MAG: RNA polymerase sigma factor [Methanococcaceae archaeon]